jgi:hypothetical protein
MTLVEDSKGGRRKALLLLALVILAAGAYFALQKHGSGAQTVAPTPVVAVAPPLPQPPPVKPKHVTADAVEEIVQEVQAERASDTAAPQYSDLAPSQRIAYQQLSGTRLLRDLEAATPPEVGFAQVIFTPPGEFYVHGLAATEADLNRFQAALTALPGSDIKPGLSRAVGPTKVAREFSFFGKVNYPASEVSQVENRVLARNRLATALKAFTDTAKSLGVEIQAPQLEKSAEAGGLQRQIYRTEAHCDYTRMQAFLDKLQGAQSSVGLLRLSLEAHGDEKMVANLDLIVYAR